MTTNPPPAPGFVRALTFEEMTPEQRAFYGPRRLDPLPQCITEYDIFGRYGDQVPSCHREKYD